MKYAVYQVQLNNDLILEINGGQSDRAHAFLKMRMLGEVEKAIELKMYAKVAEIEANDLEEVFEIGNIGPDDYITRLAERFTSVSVGDIVEAPDGTFNVVKNFGFAQVNFSQE